MNIFKVMASAQSGFREEYASAILAWLLNPSMEHGLGYSFLSEFLAELGRCEAVPKEIARMAKGALQSQLRCDSRTLPRCETYLEWYVEEARIDVVLNLDYQGQAWTIAIENKIYSRSATDPFQLKREYDGLKAETDPAFAKRRILMVFLIPREPGRDIEGVQREWANLETKDPDAKALLHWQAQGDQPSVVRALTSLLDKERNGLLDPIHESVKHLLKALRKFIDGRFLGYAYEREVATSSGLNPYTERRATYAQLRGETSGWVGVKYGLGGLLDTMARYEPLDGLNTPGLDFQFTTVDMAKKRNWMPLATFLAVAELGRQAEVPGLDEPAKLTAGQLHFLASRTTAPFFIGINRGAGALKVMDPEEIRGKRWAAGKAKKTKDWLAASEFKSILDTKGF